jgi:hypothetical protein
VKDGLWIAPPAEVRLLDLLRHAQDLPSFPNIELQVLVITLVGQLREANLLRCEAIIQIKQF